MPAEIEIEFAGLRQAARVVRAAPAELKNRALVEIARRVGLAEAKILAANTEDLARLPAETLASFRDRLTITPARLAGMLESLRQVAALPDPVGEVVEQRVLENGLKVRRVRSPLGVIFMVFESRPNVILEAFSLAFKAGNTIGLRGGRDSASTATVLYRVMRESLVAVGLPSSVFYGMNDYDRAHVTAVLQRKDLVDIAVPRGSERLIEFFEQTAVMPIIKNDRGLCHAYVDEEADLAMAVAIVDNGKTQRPGVCNSLETVLIARPVAPEFLRLLVKALAPKSVQLRCDAESLKIINSLTNNAATDAATVGTTDATSGTRSESTQATRGAPSDSAPQTQNSNLNFKLKPETLSAVPASPADWNTEYLDLILNVKIVDDMHDAIAHIETHGSRHSETIITRDETKARLFQQDIDAAAVYWNASTRFTDGFELGLGGELGISTQKLHVRGPVGLRELTTPRWIIDGTGQVRG